MKRKIDLRMYPFVKLVIPLGLGIVVGDTIWDIFPRVYWWILLCGSIFMTFVVSHWKYFQSFMMLLTIFFLGAILTIEKEHAMLIKLPKGQVEYEAIIQTEPVVHGKIIQVDLLVLSAASPLKVKADILRDTITNRYKKLHVGDGINAKSFIEKPRNFTGDSFDYARWLRFHGFSAETFIYYDQWEKARVDVRSLGVFQRVSLLMRVYRQRIVSKFEKELAGNNLAVVSAMVLGDRSQLSKNLKDDYSISGASHVLALSGLHLAVVYGLLLLLLKGLSNLLPVLRRKGLREFIILFTVWGYVTLVGFSPSVVRSAVMLTIYSFVSLLNRDRLSVNTLALTAFIMLLINPFSLFDVGFQLSFMAVWAIMVFYSPIYHALSDKLLGKSIIMRYLWAMLVVSFSAQIGTAPLIMYYFGRFSTVSLLTGFVAIPITTVILYLAFFMLLLSSFSSIDSFMGYLLNMLVDWLNTFLHCFSLLPWASIEHIHLPLLYVLAYYCLLMILSLPWSFYMADAELE